MAQSYKHHAQIAVGPRCRAIKLTTALSYNTADSTVARLYLIRHAETDLNASRIIQWPETPLNARGLWQATQIAQTLRGHRIDTIISSDYVRARVTAARLGETIGAHVSLDTRLREWHLGTLRGTPWPEAWDQFDNDTYTPPGGESGHTFHRRVDQVWQWLQSRIDGSDRPLAIVTHGLFCRALARRHLTWPGHANPPRFSNASITIVDGMAPWRILQVANDKIWGLKNNKENNYASLCTDRL